MNQFVLFYCHRLFATLKCTFKVMLNNTLVALFCCFVFSNSLMKIKQMLQLLFKTCIIIFIDCFKYLCHGLKAVLLIFNAKVNAVISVYATCQIK